jgi:ATPase subunit of ABC transporter with duplicated ATPase domains
MFVIDVSHLEFSFENGDAKLFEDLNFSLNLAEVVGLVGANGSGKSTLIKLLIGELSPIGGQIKIKSFGYLAQDPDFSDLNKTIEQIFEEKFGLDVWRGEFALEIADIGSIELSAKLKDLSGGQKTRLGLGLILAGERIPECLVLDEPTNNLDKEGLVWLKKVLKGYRGGVLIASHERAFLDEVVDRIVAIEERRLESYGGGYSLYKEQLEAKLKTKEEEYEAKLKEKKKLEQFLKRNQDLNNKTSNESYNKTKHESRLAFGYNKWDSEVSFGKKIRATHSKIDQLGEADRPGSTPILDVRLSANIPNSKIVIKVAKLNKSFGSKKVLKDFDLELRGTERILVSGVNGSGKSTLLSLIAGRSSADSGEVTIGEGLSLGYFSQDVYGLDQSKTPLEELSLMENDKSRCYTLCIKAGLSKSSADKKISELSRGQKAKLGFVKLMLSQPDVLVLDEPTNHLDVETKEAIEKALEDFGGAIILASHDKFFVGKIKINREIKLSASKH